jgi:hypothetical protein
LAEHIVNGIWQGQGFLLCGNFSHRNSGCMQPAAGVSMALAIPFGFPLEIY